MKYIHRWSSKNHNTQAEIVVGTQKRVGYYEANLGGPGLGCEQNSTVGLGASGCLKNYLTALQ